MRIKIKQLLYEKIDPDYKNFISKLLPNINDNILGIRIPLLRKTARNIIKKNDFRKYLRSACNDSFEEILLQGLVIGYADCSFAEKIFYIKSFIPKINNWSTCDSFCTSLKFTKNHLEETWQFLQPYFSSDSEFKVRFALVMLKTYYIKTTYVDKIFTILNNINHNGYYVKMATAWTISECYIKLPVQTMPFLHNNNLDKFTYNKALQKIIESYRINKQEKILLKKMKK
ncbi:DNA alkylation repair protein [Pectinatus sottacetonis]|uniref:DNA alkylation repair protein n=1 Tax=Pectinatus sottacetonis TaxID=1002795 RepID=UPI0018C7FF5A|nr:DNA alkylation repair protein [Pectinatus sottacetonis]